jgi:hypothetical protein
MDTIHCKTITQIKNDYLTVSYCGFGMRGNNKKGYVPLLMNPQKDGWIKTE